MSAQILCGIYVVRNTVNDRVYVGSSVNVGARWHAHRLRLNRGSHDCTPLQRAWVKYGEIAFVFEFIEAVEPKKEALDSREQVHLDDAFASGLAYNICRTAGGSCLGVKRSQETRDKMSDKLRGNKRALGHKRSAETLAKMVLARETRPGPSVETRAKIGLAHKGKEISAEHRAAIALAHKGVPLSPEHCEKVSLGLKGKKHSAERNKAKSLAQAGKRASAETRAKMSAARKGRPHSAEHSQNISLALKGHIVSPETGAKISVAAKARPRPPHSPETRAKMSVAAKGRPKSAEHRAKLSAALKGRPRSITKYP